MGRTLPSITQVFLQEQESLSRFRRALRRSDQLALDDLFAAARQHLAAAAYAGHALPFEVFLLAMLLEEHKMVLSLRSTLEQMRAPDCTPASPPACPPDPSVCLQRAAANWTGGQSRGRAGQQFELFKLEP